MFFVCFRDLWQCLDACRVAQLSKEYSEILEEGETVNSLRDQMKCGEKRSKVDKRWESIERREKSENDRHENEILVHNLHRK